MIEFTQTEKDKLSSIASPTPKISRWLMTEEDGTVTGMFLIGSAVMDKEFKNTQDARTWLNKTKVEYVKYTNYMHVSSATLHK